MAIISTIIVTLCCIIAVCIVGPIFAIAFEDWFLAEPRAFREYGDKRLHAMALFTREYVYGRIFFYWVGTLLFWITGSSAVGVLTKAMNSGSADVTDESTQALTVLVLVGAAATTCLARITAILYDPSLMRSMMLAVLGLFLAVMAAASFGGEVLISTLKALLPSVKTPSLLKVLTVASVSGFFTELLLAEKRRYWGRPAGSRVAVAGYSCIGCGKQGRFMHEAVWSALLEEWVARRRRVFAEGLEAGLPAVSALGIADDAIAVARKRLTDALEAAGAIGLALGGRKSLSAHSAYIDGCQTTGLPGCDHCGSDVANYLRKTGGWVSNVTANQSPEHRQPL